MRRFWQFALAGGAGLLLAGCGGDIKNQFGYPAGSKIPFNPKDARGDSYVRRDVQFEDIPVPMGFTLRRDQAFSFSGGSFRMGTFKYEGVWTTRLTDNFYREQMKQCGWTLAEATDLEVDKQPIKQQIYEKGRERCRVQIGSTENGISVLVQLYDDAQPPTAIALK